MNNRVTIALKCFGHHYLVLGVKLSIRVHFLKKLCGIAELVFGAYFEVLDSIGANAPVTPGTELEHKMEEGKLRLYSSSVFEAYLSNIFPRAFLQLLQLYDIQMHLIHKKTTRGVAWSVTQILV